MTPGLRIRSRPSTTTGDCHYCVVPTHPYKYRHYSLDAFRIRTGFHNTTLDSSSRRAFSAISLLPPMNDDNNNNDDKDDKHKRKISDTKRTVSLLPPSSNINSNNNNDEQGNDVKTASKKRRERRRRRSTRERSPSEDGTKKLSGRRRQTRKRKQKESIIQEHNRIKEIHALGTNPAELSPSHKNSIEGQFRDLYRSKQWGSWKMINDSIVMQEAKWGRNNTWKARFTCPNSGESFDCGSLKGLPDSTWIKHPTEVGSEIEEVTYFRGSNARRAVLARALDCFRFRDDPETANERFCEEMPYGSHQDITQVSPDIIDEAVIKDSTVGNGSDDDIEEDDTTSHSFETGNHSAESEDFDNDADEYYSEDNYDDDDDNDDDDEEYTITYLPGTSPGNNSHLAAPNPLARIMEGWSDTTVALQSEMKSVPVLMDKPPEKELAHLVKDANDWIQKELPSENIYASSAHRVMLQSTSFTRTLDIANSILKGLARAHSRVNFQAKSRGVEEVATKIVFHLWTTMSAQPNADTYSAYLACLEGPDPASVAIRANKILEDMKSKAPVDASIAKGSSFPEPSIGVVNAAIQLRAQIGGESGIYTSLDEIEHPTRDTFLSILSCMSYPPSVNGEAGGFDPIIAQECINAMQAVADKHPEDQSLNPDLQVYNAGLRWSGGVQSTLSRPYARPLLWDSHEVIYKDGLQPFDEDNKSVQDAYRMHAWLEEMAGLGGTITPNVETYEAVIQAYIRTGTQEGIQQAEILLDSLLDSSSYKHTLRMQTFHPVIAAWAYSGHEEGPAKVNKWISRLEALGEEAECNVQLDSRVREAPLLAHARRMTTMLESKKDFSYTETEELVDTAHGCTLHLEDMCSRLRDDSVDNHSATLLDTQMFVLVLRAWGKLGLHFLETNEGPARFDLALSKMYETVEEYEGLILSLQRKSPKRDNEEIQLQHMTRSAHKVYSAFLAILSDSANLEHAAESTWTQDGQISSIERWVRRVDEFGRINKSDKGEYSDGAGDILYSDMYSYISADSARDTGSPSQFLKQVLKYLKNDVKQSLSPQRRGDLIRLSYLTMDLLSMQRNQSSLTSSFKDMEDILDAAYDLSSRPEEREALLGRLLRRVEWIQEKKASSNNRADIDHESVTMDIRNHASFPKGSAATAGRQANARRAFRRRSGRSRSSSR